MTPSRVTPSVEFSGPIGVGGMVLRIEYAPWKVKHDLAKGKSVSLSALTVGVSKAVEFPGETLYFKGTVELSAEASLDPKKGVKYVVEQYGATTEREALAWAATQAGLAAARSWPASTSPTRSAGRSWLSPPSDGPGA
ncbi:hypothetical protein EV646_1155 [Kribbella antiqua]|uniref:Uncharacterized protein n=1 Tax=Kribbella antiqua TaxID=2512217 RepID=A0A4R2ID57_9ACTN|nr:hypothetical protein [Kribbella antiqua]TCO41468.1 hypothetical protein EV646_1155 [Kribbella antiqua]